ncbi:MAG: PAS domain S-box protein [Cyanobacteria bacterium J06573_11]
MPKSNSPTADTRPSTRKWKPARKLKHVIQNSPLAMIEWDSDGIIIGWNASAAELFSFFEDEAIGQRIDVLLAQRQLADLELGDWMRCDRKGVLREYVGIGGKKLCRWFNTPFMSKGDRVGTLSTIVEVIQPSAKSNEELRSQLQSRTQVLRHTTARLKLAMAERTQTHAALRDSEIRFQNLAANVPGVVYQLCRRTDGSHDIPYISATCQDIYELSADAIQTEPKRVLDMIDPDDRLSLELTMRQSTEKLSTWHSEHRLVTPSGKTKWVSMDAKPQKTENGDILWSGIVLDITDRKQTSQQLQTSHAFLENLVNGIADPVFVKDRNHQLILLNDAFCEFVGRKREDMVGKTDKDFMTPQKADTIWQQDERVLVTGKTHRSEDYFIDGRKQPKFISVTKSRFYALADKPYMLGTLRDLTEKVIAQNALKESEKRLKKLTANVPGVLYQFLLSAELKPSFQFVSLNSKEILGATPSEIKADAATLIDLIHPDDRAAFDQSVAESAQTLNDWNWQGRFVLSDRTVWVQGVSRPERLPDNGILWDGLLIDITALKQTEAELQRSERQLRLQTQKIKETLQTLKDTQVKLVQSEKMSSLGQLVAGIAHEINNPVNFIHGNLNHVNNYTQDLQKLVRLYQAHYPTPDSEIQTLTDDLELDYVAKDLPKLVQSIRQGTERIRDIVLSLRNFSRLDEVGLKRTDVHEGIENTLMLLGNRLKETVTRPKIELIKAYEHIPVIDCYASQLNQVFMNILANAIDAIDGAAALATKKSEDTANQATPQSPQIAIQTFQKSEHIVIQITNNGLPISQKVSQYMFDPFFTTKPIGQGTGMGLAICYQTIVGLHRGILEYRPTADHKTAFLIEIPVTQAVKSATEPVAGP